MNLNDLHIRQFLFECLERYSDHLGGVLLDLGCGRRPYYNIYQRHFGKVICADREDRCGRLDVLVDAHSLPFASNSIDVVLFSEIIEHLPNYSIALSEIERILKPDGFLFLTWPFSYSMHEIPQDFSRLTEFGIQSILRGSQLEIVQIKRRGDALAVMHTIVGQLFSNITEFLRRLPYLGPILRPFCMVLDSLVDSSYKFHFVLTRKAGRLNPFRVGEKLEGVVGSVTLWTLGYCALLRKKQNNL